MFNDMVDFVKSAYPARKFIVPCIIGPVGIGKTAAVKQAAKELGANKVVTIIASQILPNEVSGITMPVPETKAMEIFDHYRLSSLQDGDVLFFDELLEADQLVLSACLTLIESRELMSGNKLPDIMIVAATNPTIKPNMLKENIRQRFLFQQFNIDKHDVRDYIKKKCGFEVPLAILDMLITTGDEYNILSPRSLTKMCQWIASGTNENRKEIAAQINKSWNSHIGTKLLEAYNKKFNSKDRQMREALKHATISALQADHPIAVQRIDRLNTINDVSFDNASITDLMEVLQSMSEWDKIKEQLENIAVNDDEGETVCF